MGGRKRGAAVAPAAHALRRRLVARLTRAPAPQLCGEEGSGTSSAALRRSGRPGRGDVQRQESTTSLQRLAVSANAQAASAGERCVVGAVVAYACLLVLSGAGHGAGAARCGAASRPL